MNNSIWLYLLIWLLLSALMVFLLWIIRKFLPVLQKIPLLALVSIFLAAIVTWWFILAQKAVPPRPVAINLPDLAVTDSIPPEVGDKDTLIIKAVPEPRRLYTLIHPHNTMRWYLQNSSFISQDDEAKDGKNSGYWKVDLAFGPPGEDCGLKFDIIILASREPWIVDVLRNRIVYPHPGDIEFLPVLNQSDLYTVVKVCETNE